MDNSSTGQQVEVKKRSEQPSSNITHIIVDEGPMMITKQQSQTAATIDLNLGQYSSIEVEDDDVRSDLTGNEDLLFPSSKPGETNTTTTMTTTTTTTTRSTTKKPNNQHKTSAGGKRSIRKAARGVLDRLTRNNSYTNNKKPTVTTTTTNNNNNNDDNDNDNSENTSKTSNTSNTSNTNNSNNRNEKRRTSMKQTLTNNTIAKLYSSRSINSSSSSNSTSNNSPASCSVVSTEEFISEGQQQPPSSSPAAICTADSILGSTVVPGNTLLPGLAREESPLPPPPMLISSCATSDNMTALESQLQNILEHKKQLQLFQEESKLVQNRATEIEKIVQETQLQTQQLQKALELSMLSLRRHAQELFATKQELKKLDMNARHSIQSMEEAILAITNNGNTSTSRLSKGDALLIGSVSIAAATNVLQANLSTNNSQHGNALSNENAHATTTTSFTAIPNFTLSTKQSINHVNNNALRWVSAVHSLGRRTRTTPADRKQTLGRRKRTSSVDSSDRRRTSKPVLLQHAATKNSACSLTTATNRPRAVSADNVAMISSSPPATAPPPSFSTNSPTSTSSKTNDKTTMTSYAMDIHNNAKSVDTSASKSSSSSSSTTPQRKLPPRVPLISNSIIVTPTPVGPVSQILSEDEYIKTTIGTVSSLSSSSTTVNFSTLDSVSKQLQVDAPRIDVDSIGDTATATLAETTMTPHRLLRCSETSCYMRAEDLQLPSLAPAVSSADKSSLSSSTYHGGLCFIDHDIKLVMDQLYDFGYKVIADESKRFTPTNDTDRLLKKIQQAHKRRQQLQTVQQKQHPQWPIHNWYTAIEKEIFVWTGQAAGFGHDWPVVKGRGLIHTSAKKLLEFMWDSKQVKKYNKISQGRQDICIVQDDVHTTADESDYGLQGSFKIVKSVNKHMLFPKPMEVLCCLHARPLFVQPLQQQQNNNHTNPLHDSSLSYMMVSRSVWEKDPNDTSKDVIRHERDKVNRSEIILGVTIFRSMGDNLCEISTLNHLYPAGLPGMLAKKAAPSSAFNFIRDLQGLFPPNVTKKW